MKLFYPLSKVTSYPQRHLISALPRDTITTINPEDDLIDY